MNQSKQALLTKIKDRTAVVGVLGLGSVGLLSALEKAKVGFRVLCVEAVIACCPGAGVRDRMTCLPGREIGGASAAESTTFGLPSRAGVR